MSILGTVLLAAKKEKKRRAEIRSEKIRYLCRKQTKEEVTNFQAYQVSSIRGWKGADRPHDRDSVSMIDLRRMHKRFKLNNNMTHEDKEFGKGAIKYRKRSASGDRYFGRTGTTVEPIVTFSYYVSYLTDKLD
jgi:hypothetical protein